MVCHGHVTVNGKKVSIPSYSLKVNDVVEVKNNNVARQMATKGMEISTSRVVPDWIARVSVAEKLVELSTLEGLI